MNSHQLEQQLRFIETSTSDFDERMQLGYAELVFALHDVLVEEEQQAEQDRRRIMYG